MTIQLYNTKTRKKENFEPLDKNNVRMYVCGPTVYDRAHIGNARAVVVFDVLYRLLRHEYNGKVTYARNITDVDDKIIAAANERGISIEALTTETIKFFHDDMGALNCLTPDVEPRATTHIPQMIKMIQKLIDSKHAYAAEGHVLFAVESYENYGSLSRRSRDEMIAGARVEVAPYKKNAGDFVLWKPAKVGEQSFDSPWGKGRPGWHIECSAMSIEYLGETFDIHGGGADLMFPHHENEIAQSICSNPNSEFAKFWVHNGFLTVNGEKMSKSLGNFITVKDLLSEKFVQGAVIRWALLSTHYRNPLDWNEKLVLDSSLELSKLFSAQIRSVYAYEYRKNNGKRIEGSPLPEVIEALSDDMNIRLAASKLLAFAKSFDTEAEKGANLRASCELLGIECDPSIPTSFWGEDSYADVIFSILENRGINTAKQKQLHDELESIVRPQINARIAAKKARNFKEADRIRDELKAQGIILEDKPDGTTEWRKA